MKQLLRGVILAGLGLLAVLCMCRAGVSPPPSDVTAEQIRLINAQSNALEEHIAAGSGVGWTAMAFAVSVLGPIILAIWLLHRSDQAALHHDEIIRQVTRLGLTHEILDTARLLHIRPQSNSLGHQGGLRLVRDREPGTQLSKKPADEED